MPTVVCPSGLSGEIRKLRATEANLLADEGVQKKNEALDGVLRACWVSTAEFGPYKAGAGDVVDWGQVLVADRFVALLELRIATYGATYDFKTQCQQASCREQFDWHIDLRTDLPQRVIPPASLAQFVSGNRFTSTLPSIGKRVVFGLQTGVGEKAAALALKGNKARKLTVAIGSRVTEIEGVHPNDKYRFIDNLDMDDIAALLDDMDAVDGGVETTMEVQCTHCGFIQEIELPLGKDFWVPRRKKTLSVTASSPSASTPMTSGTPPSSSPIRITAAAGRI